MATVLAPASSDAISSSPAQSLPGLMAAIAEPLSSAATAPGKDDFRHAMARLGTAVNIVTTDGPGGRAGFTASAVCSVTDSPPTLLVCLNRSASVYAAFDVNGVLCVNVLGAGQQALSNLFGGKTAMGERFAAAQWHTRASGAPLLQGAQVSFDCRIVNRTSVGTHDVLFCEVQAIALGDAARGLVYLDRRYYELGE